MAPTNPDESQQPDPDASPADTGAHDGDRPELTVDYYGMESHGIFGDGSPQHSIHEGGPDRVTLMLCTLLGIDPEKLKGITVTAKVNEIATVVVTREYITAEGIDEGVTQEFAVADMAEVGSVTNGGSQVMKHSLNGEGEYNR